MMKESDFKKHMSSKQFSNLYFIDGDEKMLVSLHTEALIKKLMGDNPPEFNYHTFSGDVDISALSVSCDVVPFMSDKNCVKVSDLDIDSLAQSDVDALFDICKNIPDTTVLIFTMPTLMPASVQTATTSNVTVSLASALSFSMKITSSLVTLYCLPPV